MANLLWNESAPADTDNAGQGDDEIRSLKTSIRNGMAQEHIWPSNTGSGFGVHLLGSARAFYDVQSNVSSSGTDGRLQVTSDSSRLFHVGSAGTMFLGGQNVVSMGSQPVGGQRFYWAYESGIALTTSNGVITVSIPNSGYSGAPFVTVTAEDANKLGIYANLNGPPNNLLISITGFTKGGSVLSSVTVHWMSIGTRTF